VTSSAANDAIPGESVPECSWIFGKQPTRDLGEGTFKFLASLVVELFSPDGPNEEAL
jgi:hypothetical protein